MVGWGTGAVTGSLPTSVCCIPKRVRMRVSGEAATQKSFLFYIVFITILLLFCSSKKTGHISKNVNAKKEEKKRIYIFTYFFSGCRCLVVPTHLSGCFQALSLHERVSVIGPGPDPTPSLWRDTRSSLGVQNIPTQAHSI